MARWWLIPIFAYFATGIIVQARMFDYPVGIFWRVMVTIAWPIVLAL